MAVKLGSKSPSMRGGGPGKNNKPKASTFRPLPNRNSK